MLFIRGVVSIFYRVELFCVPFILYFLLNFVAYVFYLLFVWVVFVNKWQKGGEIDEMWESCLFCLGGVKYFFERGRIWKLFDVSNLGGELVYFCFDFVFHIIVYMSFFPHMRWCVLLSVFRKDKYILIKTFYLFLQLLG